MRRLVLVAGLAWAAAACQSLVQGEGPVGGSASTGPSAPAVHFPAGAGELATTDAAIALGNVDAQIAGYEAARARQPATAEWYAQLAGLYGARGQALGRVADYETALARAEAAVRVAPNDADALLARAAARATLHRFADAGADLDAAALHGASAEKVDAARATLLAATGRDEEALRIRARLALQHPTLTTLAAEAMSLAALGRVTEAEERFADAQARFRDVTPLPLAALYFQAGLVEERAGRPASARDFYEAARARLPEHAPATAHLATLLAATGQRAKAIALLRPLAQASDDPEYAGALAGLADGAEAEARAEAAKWRATATARYEALLARHPEAFADHAARFYLAAGAQPARALALAERNLALRQTADAYELAISASLANGHAARACGLAQQALALPSASPLLQLTATRALDGCPARSATSTPRPRRSRARATG